MGYPWTAGQKLTAADLDAAIAGALGAAADVSADLDAAKANLPFNAKDPRFGAKGDGTTDDTAALQAWLDAIAGSGARGFGAAGYLPAGWYKTGPLTITRACRVTGAGPYASVLDLKTGASGPLFTISCAYDSSDYASSYGDPMITLDNVHLTGNKNDYVGNPTGSAIKLIDAAVHFIRPNVKLLNVTIDGMPFRGIEADSFTGALEAIDCWFDNVKEDMLHAVSCNDWQFTNCIFGVANRDNLSLDSCGQFIFNACNFFSAVRYNQYLKNCSQTYFFGCSTDRAGQHGTYYDVASANAVAFIGCYWNLNSTSLTDGYSDIYVVSTSGGPILSGCMFDQTHAVISAKTTHYNVEFATTGTVAVSGGTIFENVAQSSASITTVTNLLTGLSGVQMAATGNPSDGLTATASAGFRGLNVKNAAGDLLGQIKGGNSSNQNGVLQLFKSDGSVGAQIVPTSLASFAPGTLLLFPGPYADDAAAATALVPVNYAYRKTGGTLVWRQV